MKFLFTEGETRDLIVKIEIRKPSERHEIEFLIKTKEIAFSKTANLKWNEIADLVSAFSSFAEGKVTKYFLWDHNTSAFEIVFLPKSGIVEFRIFLDPPFTHFGGFFFQMVGKTEYEPFIVFLEDSLALECPSRLENETNPITDN